VWQRLQALGEPKASVAAGSGARREWSVRTMRANAVCGMWHARQRLPGLPAAWREWAAGSATLSPWHGAQALSGCAAWRKRPLEVWHCMQVMRPGRTHGLRSHCVRV